MSSFFESSKDTYRQQMEALEQIGQAQEADSISLGLMSGAEEAKDDYVWNFVKKLRQEREGFTVEPSAPAPLIYPEVSDLDIEQFEKAVQGMNPRYMLDMVEGMEDARTMRESAGTERGTSPRPQLRPNTELIDITDTDEGKLSNPEPLYRLSEEIDPGTIKVEGLMSPPKKKHSGKFDSKEAFLKAIIPAAKKAAEKTGLDWRMIVAQSAIETGWGSKVKGNSFFGIKGHGAKDTVNFTTQEEVDGKRVTIQDSFRSYDSLEDSVEGYADFLLSNPRYESYLSADSMEEAATALQESGYATDSKYGEKVLQTANGRTLNNFLKDNPEFL